MSHQKNLLEVKNLIAIISSTKIVQNRAKNAARRKLYGLLRSESNVTEISRDALGDVVAKMLTRIEKFSDANRPIDRFKSLNQPFTMLDHKVMGFDPDRVNVFKLETDEQFIKEVKSHMLTRYLILGVKTYCNTRLRRWSNKNEKGQYGARARVVKSLNQSEVEFWTKHLGQNSSKTMEDRIDDVIQELSLKGLSTEDIQYILMYFNNYSYVEMAEELGGSDAKYRMSVKRALERADLPSVKELKATIKTM